MAPVLVPRIDAARHESTGDGEDLGNDIPHAIAGSEMEGY